MKKKVADDHDLPDALLAIDLAPYASALDRRAEELPLVDTYSVHAPQETIAATTLRELYIPAGLEGFRPFTGELAMARVTCTKTNRRRTTRIWYDRKGRSPIDTVYEANQKYARHLGYSLKRLDLITPARDILRFGAISVFLGYRKKTDAAPSCYILEAGTATGQPKVVYLGKKIGSPINAYAGYRRRPSPAPITPTTGRSL